MYDSIDLIELKRMADLGEQAKELIMWDWLHIRTGGCGFAGCLIGTWCFNTPNDELKIINSVPYIDGLCVDYACELIAHRFRIPIKVAEFLFASASSRLFRCSSPEWLTQKYAVLRLRKYNKYVERKRALFADHDDLMKLSRRDRLARLTAPRNVELQTVGLQ